MAEIITKDSEEFKELTGWMKKIGKSVEAATARIRPAIADESVLYETLRKNYRNYRQYAG